MNNPSNKVLIGISSCLLGQEVRFDGGHKKNQYISTTLGHYFEFVPFCPEVASGMDVPRPPIQLRHTEQGVRCVVVKDHNSLDVTEQLTSCAVKQHHWLERLSGYILKNDSPSCGMERVNLYKNRNVSRTGTGVFAKYILENFPLLPVEEVERLGNPLFRQSFFQRVFVMQRWKQFNASPVTPHQLIEFHSRHKLIAMSHDQNEERKLEELAMSANRENIFEISNKYVAKLIACLKILTSRDKHINVLHHIQGYLVNQLNRDDKAELNETIEEYRSGLLPLIVPVTLLQHHFNKTPVPFIEKSFYMPPYPKGYASLNDFD